MSVPAVRYQIFVELNKPEKWLSPITEVFVPSHKVAFNRFKIICCEKARPDVDSAFFTEITLPEEFVEKITALAKTRLERKALKAQALTYLNSK
jgi:hypothetical protein